MDYQRGESQRRNWLASNSTKLYLWAAWKTSPLRAVGRSENPGVPVLFAGQNLPPLVEIELNDLPKSRCAMAHNGISSMILFSNYVKGVITINMVYCPHN